MHDKGLLIYGVRGVYSEKTSTDIRADQAPGKIVLDFIGHEEGPRGNYSTETTFTQPTKTKLSNHILFTNIISIE